MEVMKDPETGFTGERWLRDLYTLLCAFSGAGLLPFGLEYAKKQQGKNKYAYYDNHRTVKQNIVILSGILKKAMAMRQEEITILSDRGKICPERRLEDWGGAGMQNCFPRSVRQTEAPLWWMF